MSRKRFIDTVWCFNRIWGNWFWIFLEGIFGQVEYSFEVPVLKAKLNSRVAYAEVSLLGQGVYEYSDLKDKREIMELAK